MHLGQLTTWSLCVWLLCFLQIATQLMALIPIATKSFRKAAAASSTAALQDNMSHEQVSKIHNALVPSHYTAWLRSIPIMAYNL